jgi:esterase/lipase
MKTIEHLGNKEVASEQIKIGGGERLLDATLTGRKLPSKVVVLMFHGMTSTKNSYTEIASVLANAGVPSLAVSLGGHGDSQGDFNTLTVNDAVADGCQAYDYLKGVVPRDSRICILGSNVGAAVAVLVANQRPVDGLVLRAPGTYTGTMMQTTFAKLMAREDELFNSMSAQVIAQTPAVASVSGCRGDLLVVASENDQIIPQSVPEAYFEHAIRARSRQKYVLLGAGHNISVGGYKRKFAQKVLQWVTDAIIDGRLGQEES